MEKSMKKVAIVADSNCGITKNEAEKLGVFLVPMPFIIDGEIFFEGVNLSVDDFFEKQLVTKITTSQPNINDVVEIWKEILKNYDEIVHIPMSSGLSKSCETANTFAQEFEGKVQVVDNHRISVTQKASVLDAVRMARDGKSAVEIKNWLEETGKDSSIYIMVNTLKYLKQGGRVTPAVAMFGEILHIKPVLQIQGGKLDHFAKVLNVKSAKAKMIDGLKRDLNGRFAEYVAMGKMKISVAHTKNDENAKIFAQEIEKIFPNLEFEYIDPLSLSVATHIGPGSLACACYRVY